MVRQVRRYDRWPSGDSRPIAVLALEPPALAQRYGLTYEEGADDLDRFQLAAIELSNGSQAWLYKYRGDPSPGTVVRVDAAVDPSEARQQVLAALELDEADILWSPDEPALPAVPTPDAPDRPAGE